MRCSDCETCIRFPTPNTKITGKCGKCRTGIDTRNKGRFNDTKVQQYV